MLPLVFDNDATIDGSSSTELITIFLTVTKMSLQKIPFIIKKTQ